MYNVIWEFLLEEKCIKNLDWYSNLLFGNFFLNKKLLNDKKNLVFYKKELCQSITKTVCRKCAKALRNEELSEIILRNQEKIFIFIWNSALWRILWSKKHKTAMLSRTSENHETHLILIILFTFGNVL